MQTKIQSMIQTKAGWQKVTIFGYSSKSVPGLEIQGLGSHGRNMKEKFVFLCKERKVSFPFKKYVLCIDLSEIKVNLEKHSIDYLELPFLMTFFYLGGLLPIYTLSDCVAVGRVDVSGKVTEPSIDTQKLVDILGEDYKLLSEKTMSHNHSLKRLSTQEILCNIPEIRFK